MLLKACRCSIFVIHSRRLDPFKAMEFSYPKRKKAMEFWGTKVKPGESVKCDPEENKVLHLSLASLGKSKGNENVSLFVKINGQTLVVGTLSADKWPQISLDLVFEKEFELYHTSKNDSVHFCGYESVMQDEQYPLADGESEPEEVPVGQNANAQSMHKNWLQDFTQRSRLPLPDYRTSDEGGIHAPRFRATVVVDGMTFTSHHTFPRRKAAEQDVAKLALEGIQRKRLTAEDNRLSPVLRVGGMSTDISPEQGFGGMSTDISPEQGLQFVSM